MSNNTNHPSYGELIKLYPLICLWGSDLGSNTSYIYGEMIRAYKDQAPYTAIYCKAEGWITIDECNENGREGYIDRYKARALELVMRS